MKFELTENQQAIRQAARGFARREMLPNAPEWDEKEIFPEQTLRRAARLGFAAVYVSNDVGGAGLTHLDATLIFEELGAACPSTAAYMSVHNMVAWIIDTYGSTDQRPRYVPKLASMEHFGSYALTEPGSGSDAASLQTRAEVDGDVYVLNGCKSFISGGGRSDVYVVMARTGGEGMDGISALLVSGDTPGLSFGKAERKLGWHSQPTRMVMFDDARVPIANRLGEEGEGFKIAMRGLDGVRLNIGACSLGAARACLEASLSYARERRQFKRRLGDFQAIQHKLADMHTDVTAARLLLHQAASRADAGAPDANFHSAMAKRYAADVGFRVCNEAMQIHGGYGYLRDYPIERYFRDARVHQILGGTNEIMRLIVARRLLAD